MYFSWEYSSVDKLALIYHEKNGLAKMKQCELPILCYLNEVLKLFRKKSIKASRLKSVEVDIPNWRRSFATENSLKIHFPIDVIDLKNLGFILKKVFVKYGELNQCHILNNTEYEPEPLKIQFSNLCSITSKLHEVLLILYALWYKVPLSTWMNIEELCLNLFCNAVNIELWYVRHPVRWYKH